MKKNEFVAFVAGKLEKSKKETGELLDGVFDAIQDALLEDGSVPLGGLGKLTVVERAPRKARNMQTGEVIEVPAKKAPKFKPSTGLKELVK